MPTSRIPYRRRVILCGSAALTLLAIEAAVRFFQPSLRAYHMSNYDRAQEGFQSADDSMIVLMGSSRVRYGLDPTIFEEVLCRKTHNVAVSASKVVEWNILARRLFKDARPRLVVLGINASEVRYDYVPTEAARHLFNADDLIESIREDGFSLDVAGVYASRALGPWWKTYDTRYELLLWGQERLAFVLPKYAQLARELRMRVAEPLPPSGYDHPWSHGRRLTNLSQKVLHEACEVVEGKAPKHDPRATTFARLGNLLDWFDQRGIRVIVAYIPNSPRTEARWIGVEPDMTACIAAVCKDKGVPFLHWDQAELPRTDNDYLDETHVGWPLAREISCRVADQIRSLALLQPATPGVDARLASMEGEP